MATQMNNDQPEISVEKATELMLCGEGAASEMGYDSHRLDMLYAMGSKFLSSGDYVNAESIFRALCLFDCNKMRFWIGLGDSLHQLGRYQEAADVFAMGASMSGLKDPAPMLKAAQSLVALGKLQEAVDTLEFIKIMGRDGVQKDREIMQQASGLLARLQQKES